MDTALLAAPKDDLEVIVMGDVHFDTVIVPDTPASSTDDPNSDIWATAPPDDRQAWQKQRRSLILRRPGGAWLLASTIDAALNTPGLAIVYPRADDRIRTALPYVCLNTAMLLDLDTDRKVYRISNALGWVYEDTDWQTELAKLLIPFFSNKYDENGIRHLDRCNPETQAQVAQGLAKGLLEALNTKPKRSRSVAVINDANNGFRRLSDPTPIAEILKRAQVVVWQMFNPLADGKLWEALPPICCEHLVVVVRFECLQEHGLMLLEDASIEHFAANIVDNLKKAPLVQLTTSCRHLVIQFWDGALHYDCHNSTIKIHYRHHAKPLERQAMSIIGYTIPFVASIVKSIGTKATPITDATITDSLAEGIREGTSLAYLLYKRGFAKAPMSGIDPPTPFEALFSKRDKLKDEVSEEDFHLASLNVAKTASGWRRLDHFFQKLEDAWDKKQPGKAMPDLALVLCNKIVILGVAALMKESRKETNFPWESGGGIQYPFMQFGKIWTIDSTDINNFLSIQTLVERYINDDTWKRPLCVAVFGPPGSGKGFTIKEILGKVKPNVGKDALEYNVAQFTSVGNLAQACHQAQDRALSGDVPLVIFDEFDVSFEGHRLGWLKYFLAPMQDGKFMDDGQMYQIGKAIFLFVGGIHNNFAAFYDKNKEDKEFQDKKGPDFVSRLRGHLDIPEIDSDVDPPPLLMIRRALLLRSILELKKKNSVFFKDTKRARVKYEVIRAFVKTKRFKHGVRSMEAIVEMALESRGWFRKASFRLKDQLAMHVDVNEFLPLLE